MRILVHILIVANTCARLQLRTSAGFNASQAPLLAGKSSAVTNRLCSQDEEENVAWTAIVAHFSHIGVEKIGNLDDLLAMVPNNTLYRNHIHTTDPSQANQYDEYYAPSLIIGGIGDSGTRAVKEAMMVLGLKFGLCDNGDPGDDVPTWAVQEYIDPLVEASGGCISSEGYRKNITAFNDAVQSEKEAAEASLECTLDDFYPPWGLKDKLAIGEGWGYKNPRTIFLIPIIDEAFHSKTNLLMVSRDPRDICTAHNQLQFQEMGRQILDMPKSAPLTREDCFMFWAKLWSNVLELTKQGPRIKIVRVEDLVIPVLEKSGDMGVSMLALSCLAEQVGLSPSTSLKYNLAEQLHTHASSYMGQHYNMTADDRQQIEQVAADVGLGYPLLYATMQKLGYDKDKYLLHPPSVPHICGWEHVSRADPRSRWH